MYTAKTGSVRVTVEPTFMPDRSEPAVWRFFWAYTVEIANLGDAPIQILARHWVITDANGRREEVEGPGVVGEQPVIEPGASFTYTSGCPLQTPSGTMVGTYRAVTGDGDVFTVAIPAFSLDLPTDRRRIN